MRANFMRLIKAAAGAGGFLAAISAVDGKNYLISGYFQRTLSELWLIPYAAFVIICAVIAWFWPDKKQVALQVRQRQDTSFVHQALHPSKFFLSKLPRSDNHLFGRENEIAQLDAAWADEKTKIIMIVAQGGIGKTALVNHWLNYMGDDNYRGATRGYGWSFFSQGFRTEQQVSEDPFFDHALRWFGYTGPPIQAPWEKGSKLAELVRQERTLLILDGLEPLQYPPGEKGGELKGLGLEALVKDLSRSNPGLCVISTRIKVNNLEPTEGHGTREISLDRLSTDTGILLLRNLRIRGPFSELADAVNEFDGHALALNLLGSYLATVHAGDILKRDMIPPLADVPDKGSHAERVMASYEVWLAGTSDLGVLYLMGLFDRPASSGAVKALLAAPAIEGLTDVLQGVNEPGWRYTVDHLRELRLIEGSESDYLDCHSMVREYFSRRLERNRPQAWKKAHSILYEYYKNIPEKRQPDTFEEMEPLFTAVAHGCKAGLHKEAAWSVYIPRIQRVQLGPEIAQQILPDRFFKTKDTPYSVYATMYLGAVSSDLALLSHYFKKTWIEPIDQFSDVVKGITLGWTGTVLMLSGRIEAGVEAMKKGYEYSLATEEWATASGCARNLSAYCILGEISKGLYYTEKGIEIADQRLKTNFHRITNRASRANVFLQMGNMSAAKDGFDEAQLLLQENYKKGPPVLLSVWGFWHCDFLLDNGLYEEAIKQAELMIEYDEDNKTWGIGTIDTAFAYLSLGRAMVLLADQQKKDISSEAIDHIDSAIKGIRESGLQWFLPSGLLARAQLYRIQGNFKDAWDALADVYEISEREMPPYMADYHLEACRLSLAERKPGLARAHLENADSLKIKISYHRRDQEVAKLNAAVGNFVR